MNHPRIFLLLCRLHSACLIGCDRKPAKSVAEAAPTPSVITPPAPPGPHTLFTEITGQVGFDENPKPYADGTNMTPEITPGGVALLDVQNTGRLDILMVCHPAPGPNAFKETAPNRLFRENIRRAFQNHAIFGTESGTVGQKKTGPLTARPFHRFLIQRAYLADRIEYYEVLARFYCHGLRLPATCAMIRCQAYRRLYGDDNGSLREHSSTVRAGNS